MKTIRPIISLTAALLFLWGGCTEDKGSYDYTDIIYITMPEIPPLYVLQQLDELVIEPAWSFPAPRSVNDFEFNWIIQGTLLNARDTIGREPDLRYTVDLPLGDYQIYCFVKDRIDQRSYSISTSLSVENFSSTGMMVLSNVNGYANVTFINLMDEVLTDVYTTRNGAPAGRNPRQIVFSGHNNDGWSNFAKQDLSVFILCDDPVGGVVCDPFLFTHLYDLRDMFIFPPDKVQGQYLFNPSSGQQEILVRDNKPHFRSIADAGYPQFMLEGESDLEYSLFPHISYSVLSYMTGYCQLQQRFISFTSYVNPVPRIAHVDPDKFQDIPSPLNPGNVGMEMIHFTSLLGDGGGGPMPIRAILRDDQGKYYLYAAQVWFDITPNYVTDLSVHPQLEGATAYAFTGTGNICFIGVGDKIYSLGGESNILFNEYTFTDLEPGEYVEYMELEKILDKVYVGVGNGSGEPGSGSVYIFSPNSNTGELTLEKTYRHVAGSIVDFDYKQM